MMPRANFSDLLKSSALARCCCKKKVVAIYNEDVSLHAHKGPDFVVDLDLLWSGDNPLVNDRKFCRRGQRKVDIVMTPQVCIAWEIAVANSQKRIAKAQAEAKAFSDLGATKKKGEKDTKEVEMEVDAGEVEFVDTVPAPKTSENPSDTVAGALDEIAASLTAPLPPRLPRSQPSGPQPAQPTATEVMEAQKNLQRRKIFETAPMFPRLLQILETMEIK